MFLSLYFASHVRDSQARLEEAINHFCETNARFAPVCEIKKVYETASGEIFSVSARCRDLLNAGERDPAERDLARSLMAEALNRRFIPLDDKGNEIYLTPPYGFDIIFYHPEGGQEAELQNLVIRIANEMPGHEGKFNIQTHKPEDEPGEYYLLSIRIQDYWTRAARHRLMLAFYFRLNMLAGQAGFEAAVTSRNER